MDLRKVLGGSGEDQAVAFLKKRGFRIVERNWRTALGEIDVIASDRSTLVFVEVRTRSGAYATPEDSVSDTKQRRLARLAEAYVARKHYAGDWRIDVVAIDEDGIRHLVSAVEE